MTTDVVAKQVREALWHVDAQLEEHGWGQASQLWAVSVMEGEVMRSIIMFPLPGWEQVRAQAPSHEACLAFLADMYARMPQTLKKKVSPGSLFGLAFSSEAYMLRYQGSQEELDKLQESLRERDVSIGKSPDMIETRMVYLVPLDGPPAMLLHERDGIAELHEDDAEGDVATLLARLVQALLP